MTTLYKKMRKKSIVFILFSPEIINKIETETKNTAPHLWHEAVFEKFLFTGFYPQERAVYIS